MKQNLRWGWQWDAKITNMAICIKTRSIIFIIFLFYYHFHIKQTQRWLQSNISNDNAGNMSFNCQWYLSINASFQGQFMLYFKFHCLTLQGLPCFNFYWEFFCRKWFVVTNIDFIVRCLKTKTKNKQSSTAESTMIFLQNKFLAVYAENMLLL